MQNFPEGQSKHVMRSQAFVDQIHQILDDVENLS